MAFQAFLSHSTRDQALVDQIKERVVAAGVQLYLAEHDPHPGRLLSQKVQEAIDRSPAVVLLLTPNSYDSAFVHQEVGYAIKGRKIVIPLVDPLVPHEALAMLEGREYILLNPDRSKAALAVLSDQLENRVTQHERDELWVAIVIIAVLMLLLATAE